MLYLGTTDAVVDHIEKADAIFRATSFDSQGNINNFLPIQG